MTDAVRKDGDGRIAASLPGIAASGSLFAYLYCMLASTAIISRPIPGGALFMIGQVTLLFVKLIRPGDFRRLPGSMRRGGLFLGALSALFALGILLIYPLAVDLPGVWLIFALSLMVLAMGELMETVERACRHRGLNRVRHTVRQAELALLFCGAAALILFLSLSAQAAWYLLGGFALCCLFQLISVRRADIRSREAGTPSRGLGDEYAQLAQVNAYKVFRAVMMITVTALQVTMILIYTFIGTTADSLLSSLLIAFFCTFLAQWLTTRLFRRSLARHRLEPSTALLTGLVLWFLSLVSFSLRSFDTGAAFSYAALALCSAGVTMSSRALEVMERDMRDVVRFATGSPAGEALVQGHAALREYSALIGGMIALLGLALVTLISGGSITGERIRLVTQPMLLLPALALVGAAVPIALRFPLDRRVITKVRTFLKIKENGETNLPLQKQLEDLIVKVHRKRYGIKLLILFLRPFFYSRVIGQDKVRPEPGTSCVFTCNHGEIWGPVVTNLFIPFSFRPWVINEISEASESTTYLYDYTFKRQKWLPEKLKWPATRLTTAFLKWCMRSLDSITVYRDSPLALMRTFRNTAAAMEAGDNILIFPENPNDPSLEKPGYLREGIGPFFSGFAMVAQFYYQHTGKRAQFYPIYADKKAHTLTFGEPVRYDPDAPANEEKQRIADHLRNEMFRMANENAADEGRRG